MQPRVQFFAVASPSCDTKAGVVLCSVCVGLYMVGPLYSVITVAPVTQNMVPSTFAMPSFRSSRTFSILYSGNEQTGISYHVYKNTCLTIQKNKERPVFWSLCTRARSFLRILFLRERWGLSLPE